MAKPEPLSRLDLALVLILIVAIPFLVTMIIVYIYFALDKTKEIKCEEVCDTPGINALRRFIDSVKQRYDEGKQRKYKEDENKKYYPEKTTSTIKEDGTSEYFTNNTVEWETATAESTITTTEDYCKTNFSSTYPYLAALIESLYQDFDGEKILKCIVPLLYREWILLSSECIKDSSRDKLSLRLLSDNWSRGGILASIGMISDTDKSRTNILAATIKPHEPSSCFRGSKLSESKLLASTKTARTFDWGAQLEMPLHQRLMYQPIKEIEIELFAPEDCPKRADLPKFVCSKSPLTSIECPTTILAPLFKDEIVIGIPLTSYCDRENRTVIIYYEDVKDAISKHQRLNRIFL